MTDRATMIADTVLAALKNFKREDPLMFHAVIVEAVHEVDAALEGARQDLMTYGSSAIKFSEDGTAKHIPLRELETPCQATQQNDEMFCPICDLRWDVGKEKPKVAKCLPLEVDEDNIT